ncbi:hypothetical protein BGZ94_005783 [Podila epigama]|nr:hypothetical protein BGZ94_005783 [Podila epigama]
MTEKLSNTYNSAIGGAKESIGKVTGNQNLAGSGAAQKSEAQVAQQRADAERHAKGVGHNIQGAAQRVAGSATHDHSLEARGHGNSALGDVQRNV